MRQQLELDADTLVVAGMALGFEDTEAAINQYRTERQPVTQLCRFLRD